MKKIFEDRKVREKKFHDQRYAGDKRKILSSVYDFAKVSNGCNFSVVPFNARTIDGEHTAFRSLDQRASDVIKAKQTRCQIEKCNKYCTRYFRDCSKPVDEFCNTA